LDGVTEVLNSLAQQLADENRLYKAGQMAADMIRNHIDTGDGFEPLAPATAAYRGAGKPLEDTGGLRDSITAELIGNETVSVGTVNRIAPVQNDGMKITAKKNWLFIPAAGTRQLERRYGRAPGAVLSGLKASGYSVFRMGRTVCYKRKESKRAKIRTAYYLKKSVVIPKREFFYLTDDEIAVILGVVAPEV
jgi:phage gpG-like protein